MAENTEGSNTHDRRAAVVFNPTKVDIDELKAAVAAEAAARDWKPTLWFETTAEDPGSGQTKDAIAAGASVIIAAGGDGTVRAVAEQLDGTDVAMAIVPAGTGNLLARNLGLPIDDVALSLQTAFDGRDRAIDLGRIEIRRPDSTLARHAFVVMAGLGLDAKMLEETDDDLKERIGWLAYVKAIATALRKTEQVRLRFALDGAQPRTMRAHTLIVGNCGTLTGNIQLLPEAAVDNGQLNIVILRPNSGLGWVQIIAKVVWENGVLHRVRGGPLRRTKEVHALKYLTGRELIVRLAEPEGIELDGDQFGQASAIKVTIVAGGLTVRVPRQS
jgi:diacylglycerol kinase (ATP)